METCMEERLRTGKGHWIRMGKSTKNRSGYMEMFSNCDFSYSSESANFHNTIAFKRLAHTDYFRTANQNAVRERHERNGYENTQKKQIGKTTGETYMENYKRNALEPTVRRTTWKTSRKPQFGHLSRRVFAIKNNFDEIVFIKVIVSYCNLGNYKGFTNRFWQLYLKIKYGKNQT